MVWCWTGWTVTVHVRLVNNAEDWVRVGLLSGFGGC